MSHVDTHIDGLVTDACEVLDRERAAVVPDFAAVLARAGLRAPDEAPAPGENVVELRAHGRANSTDALVDALVGDAREAIDRMVTERRMRPIPELVTARPPTRRRAAIGVGVALLAAAAVALFAGLQWAPSLRPITADAAREQAFSSQVEGGPDGVAHEAEPARPPIRTAREPVVAVPAPEAVSTIAPVAPEHAPRRAASDRDRLRALADQAHALWRAGDRSGAERMFERIVQLGGRSSQAELAWGDLFALARQLHDGKLQRTRWRRYLERFPNGRFADDARAGMCRSSAGSTTCWTDYLRDFPRGSYRAEAGLATERERP
jgi:hypothetical protein